MNIKTKHDQPLLVVGLFLALCVTLLRSIRWPNDWAEAHWMLNYGFGFLKRSLPGTLFKPIIYSGNASANAEFVIRLLSSMFLLIFFAVILWVCIRIVRKSQFSIRSVLFVFIFLTSPYIVMSAHINGYYDNILILLSFLACLLVINGMPWLAAITIAVGIFVHETILWVGFPTVLCVAFVQYVNRMDSTNISRLLKGFFARYFMLFLIPLLAFIFVIIHQTLFMDQTIRAKLTMHLSQYDFIQRNRNVMVPKAITTSFFHYLKSQSPYFLSRIAMFLYVIHILVPLSILFIFVWDAIKNVYISKAIFIIIIAITLLPLTLHLVAWDTSRIWTYPLVVVLLTMWGVCEVIPAADIKKVESLLYIMCATVVMIFHLFMRTALMDRESERFTYELRIVYYAPSLILIALLIAKNYRLSRRSS